MNHRLLSRLLTFQALFFANIGISQQGPVYQSKEYSIYPNRVVQHNFEAKTISGSEIISNYESPDNLYQPAEITFKFSINGKDNEMKPGSDHHFIISKAINETPLIKFGEPLKELNSFNEFLKPGAKLTVRLDMRQVLADFNSKGFFITYNGEKIFKEDFKGVYIAGATAPLTWDFDNLVNHPELQLHDMDGKGIYETTLTLLSQKDKKQTDALWKLSKNTSAFPQYHSEYPMTDALYSMSLEEMMNAIEPDSTFRTGKLWAGVWTRDISYSIILSMAYLQPLVAKNSLLRKVSTDGRIIQDTGTGGAYPCSTDRMIWAVAAWEVYLATGDKEWLKKAYEVIKNSIKDDMHNAYDKATGMVRGESSFLDWREQTYPKWMQPADIYNSENLGTNAVHYEANMVAAEMATLLHDGMNAIRFKQNAAKIKAGINQLLWMKKEGYYAQYLYGRNFKMISPRSEALGEALCVLFDIANPRQQMDIIAKTPVIAFGVPCIYPQIPGIPPYHNNAVWPFVESYWAMASAKAGNETSVMEALSSIARAQSLFATNKENFVADNGDFAGTQINSSNMLWSLSGSLAMIHKVIFGIRLQSSELIFHPFVPKALAGKRTLTNFAYRKAVLDISLEGYGHTIRSFMLDGKKMNTAKIPATLKGKHVINIQLDNYLPVSGITKVANHSSPDIPIVQYSSNTLSWQPIKGGKEYAVYKNGELFLKTTLTKLRLPRDVDAEYQVMCIDKNNLGSFASEPIIVTDSVQVIEMEDITAKSTLPFKGYTGSGFVEINKNTNTSIRIPVTISTEGMYSIDFRYANGNGPTNTENKCAIRTLKEGNTLEATVIFPQRGRDEWSNWGYSNGVKVELDKGQHVFILSLEDWNENMNKKINGAILDNMRITKFNR